MSDRFVRLRLRHLSALLVLALAPVACSDDPIEPQPDPVPATVNLTVPFDSLLVGETATVQAVVLDGTGAVLTDETVTWTSSDSDVATVTATGQVTAVGVGEVTLRATAGTAQGQATFDVVLEWVAFESLVDGEVSVEQDPSGVAPLTAELTFATVAPAVVELTVPGMDAAGTLRWSTGVAAEEHTLPVLGLYPGMDNEVEIHVETASARATGTVTLSTDPLPDFLPDITVNTAVPASMEPGWTLSSLSIGGGGWLPGYPIMFDTHGDIRWYLNLSYMGGLVFAVERLANGNLIVGRGPVIRELDMLGREINRWDIDGYNFHHDVIEMGPGGNLLVAVDKDGLATEEDHIIEVDRVTGAIVREWDLRQILDQERTIYSGELEDWFHMNSVWWDPEDGSIITSGRNQTAVVKITADNELVWILGPHRGWDAPWSDFLLTAVDENGQPYADNIQLGDTEAGPDFRWPWGQHAAMWLPNGNIFIFDNGLGRTWTQDGPLFSRGVEYEIDEEAMTLRQVWQYGEERGQEYYSRIISDVDYLPETGNRLVMPGLVQDNSKAFVTEVTHPDGEVVFDAVLEFKRSEGGPLDLVYRSERLTPYPSGG